MRKTKALVFTLVLMMAVGSSLLLPATGFSECPDGITGYWKLDDTASPFTDFVAGNDAATSTGGPVPASAEGINGALQFTGSNADGLLIPASSAFNWTGTESFSIELWVKTDGVTSAGVTDVFIARNVGTTALQWWIGVNKENGYAAFRIQTSDANVATAEGTTTDINDGGWHHLVFVRDGAADTNTLYVDGGAAAGGEDIADPYDFTAAFDSNTVGVTLGYLQGSADYYLDGYLDEVAIYGRALTAGEISAHAGASTDYCAGSEAISIFAPFPDNTTALWHFDETGGSTYADAFSGLHDAETGTGDPDAATTEGINGAQQFVAANTDGLIVPASSAFNWTGTESFSIELWVKTDGVTSAGETDVLIARNVGATAVQWWIGVNKENGYAAFRIQTDDSNVATAEGTTTNINDGGWHHLVFVRDGGADTNTLYVDGGSAGSGEDIADPYDFTSDFSSNTVPLSIGYLQAGSFYFDGYLDEIAIYGKALTTTEIGDHFTTGQGVGGQSVTALRPAPTANATTSTPSVTEGATVTLNGSTSTTYPDASITEYAWTQTAGTTATLSDATAAQPTFTAPDVTTATTLTFSLTVTASDGQTSSADTVDVVVNDTTAPTANAGPAQSVTEGDLVTLDGRSSAAGEGGTLTYAWTQTAGTTVTLSDATAVQPTFTAPDVDAAGEVLTFQLIVTENSVASAPSTVNITVGDVTTNPDADAGADQSVTEGETVTLDASASTAAPGATITAYQWTQTDTSGFTVTLSDATAIQPTFAAPDVTATTILTFQLTVTDDGDRTATDTVDVTVNISGGGGGGGGGGCFIGTMF